MADAVREDFDRIAGLAPSPWDHNSHYHGYLLRQLPASFDTALDVGCGSGEWSRLLATRARRVVGIDLSPAMIEAARARSRGIDSLDYRVADVTRTELPPSSFDCVSCIATLHHLPLREALERLAGAVSPGGTLLILDLYRPASAADFVVAAAAVLPNLIARLVRTGQIRMGREAREAWARHAAHDVTPTLAELRRAVAETLPGAVVRRHLYWRYSLVATRSAPGGAGWRPTVWHRSSAF